MKKYLYAGIILGTIVLAGCVKEKTEGPPVGQAVEAEPLSVVDTHEAEAPAPLKLAHDQQEAYYKQYAAIIDEINATAPNTGISIEPIEKFENEDFMPIEDFKATAISRANSVITDAPEETDHLTASFYKKDSGDFPSVSSTQTIVIDLGPVVRAINVTGTFTTKISAAAKSQVFSKVESITSESAGAGTWVQTDYDVKRTEGGRTYVITLEGYYTQDGVTIKPKQPITVHFYCNTGGVII